MKVVHFNRLALYRGDFVTPQIETIRIKSCNKFSFYHDICIHFLKLVLTSSIQQLHLFIDLGAIEFPQILYLCFIELWYILF